MCSILIDVTIIQSVFVELSLANRVTIHSFFSNVILVLKNSTSFESMVDDYLEKKLAQALRSFLDYKPSAPYPMLLYAMSLHRKIIAEYNHIKIFITAQLAFML